MGIKVQDVAFVRFRAPDLDAMEEFLVDFGMVRADRTKDTLYMRGTDGDPFLHVTHRGEAGFAGVAFEAASPGDLETIAHSRRRLDGTARRTGRRRGSQVDRAGRVRGRSRGRAASSPRRLSCLASASATIHTKLPG